LRATREIGLTGSVAIFSLAGQFEQPYGPMGPPTLFTIPVLRYMKTYGLTHEQLAMVSVVQREWARATFKTPITVEDVLNSRMIAYPFQLLQCCLVTDGGGALILVSAERARDFPQSLPLATNRGPVYLLGTGESVETPMVNQMEDFTSSRAFRVAGPKAFAEAGITHNDVNHLMIYDAPCSLPGASFAHLPIYGLEDLGFVPRDEAGAFIAEHNTAPGRPIAAQHQWRRPFLHAFRHVRHVRIARERAPDARHRPSPDPDAKISVCHGVGGMFAASGTIIMSNEPP
jgi:acetyl-CoA acetyltransferase